MNNPIDYGIRLAHWRPNQFEAIQGIRDSKKRFVVIEGKTGTGKTAVGMALAKDNIIRVVTKTRSLQDQYSNSTYSGKVLYGLSAYPCALLPGFTATECVFPGDMNDCPRSGTCGYLQAKNKMITSNKQVISYAYWFTAGWLTKEEHFADLYFDEAHEIPAVTMNYLEKRFDRKWANYLKIRLPNFPHTEVQFALQMIAKKWLESSIFALKEEATYLKDHAGSVDSGSNDLIKRMIKLQNEAGSMEAILYQLTHRPDEMMVIIHDDHDFTIAPLTARMFRGFLNSHKFNKATFTSATIGNPATFMGGIGFEKAVYDYIDVPSNFSAESMPVYVPPGSPRIGYNSSEQDLMQQAKIIVDIIQRCPSEWSGFVHTASISQAHAIANRMSALDPELASRVWVPGRESSSAKIESWQTRKMIYPNTIAVSWDFWTGLDAYDEEINIVAKVPFGTLDRLGKARMELDKTFYAWEAACKIEQAAGRNRRGTPDHYEVPGEPTRRVCAVVDSSIYRVYNQFSGLFKQRMECVKNQNVEIRR